MDNNRRNLIRRVMSGLSGLTFFFFLIIILGLQLDFFNIYNPFYNSTYMIGFSFIFFVARSYLKDRKETVTVLGFFDSTGLTDAYDIDKANEDSTHLKMEDESGNVLSVKHAHPFLVPTDDGYERLYLSPRKGKKAINPKELVRRYGQEFTQEQVNVLKTIPEMKTLNPDELIKDMTEADDADTLMEEFTHHVAEIRKGFLGKLSLKENWFMFLMIGGTSALLITIVYMIAGINFSNVRI